MKIIKNEKRTMSSPRFLILWSVVELLLLQSMVLGQKTDTPTTREMKFD